MIDNYLATFDELAVDGIFGISLVENPATKEYFIQLSKEQKADVLKKGYDIQFKTVNKEKRLVTGLVLEPNSPVYRKEQLSDGTFHEFNIVFEAHTIEALAFNFYKSDFHKNSTIEHDLENKIKGVTFVESWIIEDSKNDKSNALGLEHPKGSWMISMKVDDIELWNDYIKTGKVKGFSVDGMVQLKKINSKTDIKMSTTISETLQGWKDKMIAFATPKKEEIVEVKMGEVKMEGGEVIFEYEGEDFVVGGNVFAIDPQDASNKIPVPVGSYPLEDGRTLVVAEEGIVAEITPVGGEEVTEETEEVATDMATATDSATKTVGETAPKGTDIKSILIKYEEDKKSNNERLEAIENSMIEFGKMAKTMTDIKKEVVAFSEQPSAKPKKRAQARETTSKGRIAQAIRNAE